MRSGRPTIVAVGCALLTVVIGLLVAGDRTAGGIDVVATRAVTGLPDGLLHALLLPTEPYLVVPVLALAVFWCWYTTRPWDALLVVLGPALALAVNTWLLKPLFDRWLAGTLAYPSGHTVGMVATLAVVFLLLDGPGRTATVVVGAVLLTGVTTGMLGLGYHYLTDVVGGAFFAVSAVLAVRELLLWSRRRRPAPRRGRRGW